MECHKGYAVLMDEDSVFVNAANLGYEVGQTVTAPVLMESGKYETRIVMSLAAAAACLVVMCGAGYHYYSVNYKTHSTVIISSNAGVKMYLNKKDKVIKLESVSPEGEAILSGYSGKGKDKNDAISEIVEIGISKGYISDGDTVSVYIPESDSDSTRKEIEDDLAGMSVKADVQPIDNYCGNTEKDKPEPASLQAPEPPSPPDDGKEVPAPPRPEENGEVPTAPEPPSAPSERHKPPEPPEPPAENGDVKPEPPTAPKPPEEGVLPDDPAKKKPEEHLHPDVKLPHEKEAAAPPKADTVHPVLPEKAALP